MRVLFYDPGAERAGWSVIEGGAGYEAKLIDSGITYCPRRQDEDFQPYKLRLEEFWTLIGPAHLHEYKPDAVVNEIVPAVGGGNFVAATQSNLASAMISTVHAMAFERAFMVAQIAATSIKKAIGGKGNATKVAVRNGVIALFPKLSPRRVDWIKIFDESDAIAGGLTYLGYKKDLYGKKEGKVSTS